MFPQTTDLLTQLQAIKDKILEIKVSGKDASTLETVIIWGQYFNLLAQAMEEKETTEQTPRSLSATEAIKDFLSFVEENVPPLAVKIPGQKEEIWATWETKDREYTPAKILSMGWQAEK
jgi:hypothetical protein